MKRAIGRYAGALLALTIGASVGFVLLAAYLTANP